MKQSGKSAAKAAKNPAPAKKPRAAAEESALREKTETLAALTDALTAFLEHGSFNTAFGRLLKYALERTGSEYGFAGVMVEGPALRVLAHEGMVWDTRVNREFYENAVRAYEAAGYLEFKSFDNLFGRVMATGQVVVSNDPAHDPRSGGLPPGHPPLKAFLGVPICRGTEVLGMFGVANRAGGYSGTEQRRIEALVRQAAVLCDSYLRREREASLTAERARAREEAQVHLDRLRAVHEIDLAITSSLDLDRVLSVLLEKIDVFFPYETASTVRLFEPGAERLAYTACHNLDEEDWRMQPVLTVRGRGKEILETKRPVAIRNLQTDPRTGRHPYYARNRLVSYLGVPLMTGDQVLGIFSLYTREERDFTPDEVDSLATLAAQGAIAIHNAQLHREARQRAEEQMALAAVAQATSRSLSLGDVLDLAMDAVLRLTKREKGYIRLKDPITGQINLALQQGVSDEYARILLHERSAGGRSDQVFDTGEPLVINDPSRAHPKEAALREQVTCAAWIPIKARGKTIGVLNISDSRPMAFPRREIEVLKAIGNVIGIAVENSRLFERTKEQAEILARANRVKDDFLGTVSHELRTPLNVVVGYTAMMKDGLLGEINSQQAEALQKVMERAEEQLAMINNVLYATALDGREQAVETQELSPSRFLDQLKAQYDARLFPVPLRWDYPGDLPAIKTDGGKLRIILQNLIGNAIKFTGKGVISVSAEMIEGGRVQFKVADTGIGISESQLPFIFEKFRQADGSPTRHYGGVGMGLYIVKRFTELLGGTVKVESEPDRGSTFTVTIPA